ncbi:MAG: hypothetical protein HYY93_12600 [Planctomycetes bacterium]|nr:hypothetical protein [Planctomycetota bacterium]
MPSLAYGLGKLLGEKPLNGAGGDRFSRQGVVKHIEAVDVLVARERQPVHAAEIGLVPAGGGDLVVYVTNLGVVAACDALTGQVRWVVLAGSERPESRRLVSRAVTWGDNPPFVVGSSVVVTPQDSDLGLVLDRESGRLLDALSTRPAGASLWPGERDGVLYRYLVADGRGRMAFSGAALRIVDGGESVPGAGDGGTGSTRRLDEPAIGRGYWSGGVYYFPAASGLMAFDTRDPGAGVVRIMDWDRPTDSPCEVVAGEGWGMVVWRTGVWMVPLR